MTHEQATVPQWVCIHCFVHLVNGDCTDVWSGEGDEYIGCSEEGRVPMNLFGDMHITPGMLWSEHACCGGCNVHTADECDCETITFSWSACDGCGSLLGGERHAVTGWIKEESKS